MYSRAADYEYRAAAVQIAERDECCATSEPRGTAKPEKRAVLLYEFVLPGADGTRS